MITDIAWDFDGTLFDSYPFILECFRKALLDCGFTDSDERILAHIKVTVTNALHFYGTTYGIPQEMLLACFQRYNKTPNWDLVKPYPGVRDCLAFVVESGKRNHLYTHRSKEAVSYLEHSGLKGFFSSFITSEDGFPPKPAPDALNALTAKRHIKHENLLMVGDRPIDIDAAWNAGCQSCFYNSNRLPQPQHATYHVDDYRQLQQLFRNFMPQQALSRQS